MSIYDITGSVSSAITIGDIVNHIESGDVVKIAVPFDVSTWGWYTFDKAYNAMGVYYLGGTCEYKNASGWANEGVDIHGMSSTSSITSTAITSYTFPININFYMSYLGSYSAGATGTLYSFSLSNGANYASICNAFNADNIVNLRCNNLSVMGAASGKWKFEINWASVSNATVYSFQGVEIFQYTDAGTMSRYLIYNHDQTSSATSIVYMKIL